MAIPHDYHMTLVAMGDQLVLSLAWDAGGVEEPAVLAHVQGKGVDHVGCIPREGGGNKPTCRESQMVKYVERS